VRLLDLFCGAGGAAMGYHQAGFDEIVGVDIEPQPNYPFEFIQEDITHWTDDMAAFAEWVSEEDFDLIHASPPCQAYSTLKHSPGAGEYPDLVGRVRSALASFALPYVIENVVGAPIQGPVLCGSQFGLEADGHELRRHRVFEASFLFMVEPCRHRLPVLGVYGDLSKNSRPSTRGVKAGIKQAEALMGIDWMTPSELVEAIPPAYTKFIGEQFLALTPQGET
jgi:DNA (cytosine-5)-methyltransferase 1